MPQASDVQIKFYNRRTAAPEHPGCDWADVSTPGRYFGELLILSKPTKAALIVLCTSCGLYYGIVGEPCSNTSCGGVILT